MSALLNGIHDRSTVVQKQFAFALGHLVRVGGASSKLFFLLNSSHCSSEVVFVSMQCCLSLQTAKDSSVEKLLLKLNNWYLEKEGKIKKGGNPSFPLNMSQLVCVTSN